MCFWNNSVLIQNKKKEKKRKEKNLKSEYFEKTRKMVCCRTFAKRFVMGISIIDILVALAIIIVASVTLGEVGDELEETSLNSPVIVSLVVGSLMFVFGLLGCFGAWKDIKLFLIAYSLATFIFTSMLIAFGIVVLVQSGEIENVENLDNPSTSVENNVQAFGLAAFVVCCDLDDLQIAALDCDVALEEPCLDEENQERFDQVVDFLGDENAATCQLLQQLEADGKPLINGTEIGEGDICGEEDAGAFIEESAGFVRENFIKIGIANLVTGIILLLLLIFSCVLIFTNDEEFGPKGKEY